MKWWKCVLWAGNRTSGWEVSLPVYIVGMQAITIISGETPFSNTELRWVFKRVRRRWKFHMCTYARWKFIWADANEDLFDLTVKINGWVLRSLRRRDESREKRNLNFKLILLRGLCATGMRRRWEWTYRECGVHQINWCFEKASLESFW